MNENKYKNKKIEYNGIKFDSKMEMDFYLYLLKIYPKEIFDNIEIKLQPKFLLQSSFRDNGKLYREISYIADFEITKNETESSIVFDVKGFKTKDFIIKEKLFRYKYPNKTLRLMVKAPKYTGEEWIEIDELKRLKKCTSK